MLQFILLQHLCYFTAHQATALDNQILLMFFSDPYIVIQLTDLVPPLWK